MRPRVLLSVSCRGWSFDHIGQQLALRLADRFDITLATLADIAGNASFDVAVSFFWHEMPRLRARLASGARHIACVYDHASWSGESERRQFTGFINHGADLVVVGSPLLAEEVSSLVGKPVVVCQDGVDFERFPQQPLPETFAVGWTGNEHIRAGDHKGVGLIREAAQRAGIPFVIQGYDDRVPQAKMAEKFYRRISAYVCASLSEGTPNPVLEALACGRPVVSTAVGLVPQLVQAGAPIVTVSRDVESIMNGMVFLRDVGATGASRARESLEDGGFGWDVAAARWAKAITQVLG